MAEHAPIEALLYLCCALSVGLLAHGAASVVALPRPTTGQRGLARQQALGSEAFALVEPLLRWLGAIVRELAPAGLRAAMARQLSQGATLAGLDADELLALCLLGGAAGAALAAFFEAPTWALLGGIALGLCMPYAQVREKARKRQFDIARALPTAIDVMALAMGAGLGFAAALELATREALDPQSPLGQELARVRQAIATGHARNAALEALAERVPCDTVRDFAGAVVQGELKGTPLAGVLEIQARTLRTRRAVAAEEAAARASVLLVLPLMLLLCAVMLLMFGPFIVHGVGL